MFDITPIATGIRITGRFDAAAAPVADVHFRQLQGLVDVDLSTLDYISSAGLGVMLKSHKRLTGEGGGLRLVEVNPHIVEILHYSGFDMLFEVIPAEWSR